MAKGSIDRLNETVDQIPEIAKRYPNLFTGVSASKLRSHLVKTLQDDPCFDLNDNQRGHLAGRVPADQVRFDDGATAHQAVHVAGSSLYYGVSGSDPIVK